VTVIPLGRPLLDGSSDLPGSSALRAETHEGCCHPQFLPYLVLLRVGFALPRTLLPGRCALTAPFHPYLGLAPGAVCSLWHFPSNGLKSILPDVIRHTALRSSDFPPSSRAAWASPAFAAGRQPSGPASTTSYYKTRRPPSGCRSDAGVMPGLRKFRLLFRPQLVLCSHITELWLPGRTSMYRAGPYVSRAF
jgi:hypothetical protein